MPHPTALLPPSRHHSHTCCRQQRQCCTGGEPWLACYLQMQDLRWFCKAPTGSFAREQNAIVHVRGNAQQGHAAHEHGAAMHKIRSVGHHVCGR